MTGKPASNSRLRDWLWGGLLVAATLIAFHPAGRAGFIWDDAAYLTENRLLTAPDGLRRIWFSLDSPSQYFPLTYTTFYLERAVRGLNPASYHWVNILLHAANVVLVWKVLTRLGAPGAWLAAAVFALHPVQVESVAWITERKNVLMGFFFLLTVWAWIRFVDEKTARPWRFYAMALCCYPLALFAKTTACTLPAALLLILWLKKRPIYWRRLAQVAPFVVMAIGMGLVTVWWERFHQGTQGKLFDLGPVERLLIASRALWFYLDKLLWPANLTFIYPRWNISTADPLAYGWLLATAAAVAVIWRARRWTGRGVEVAAIYYAATLSPVLGFIMLYTFVYSFVADHYQYLACIGPIALAAAGLELGLRRLPRARAFLQPALCAALLLTLGALTWRQCGMYADIDTLWRATIGRNPNCWLALNDLGADLYDQGHVDQAIVLLRKSAAIQPDNAETQNNLGAALDQEGQENEALLRFQKALALRPYFAEAHRNLGDLLLRQGHIDEAIAHFQAAITLRPDIAKAHRSLGEALVQKGEVNEGILQFQEALKLDPHYAPAYYTAGTLLLQQGRIDEAIAQFQKLLALRPDFAEAQNNLGYCLLQKGRAEEAITYLRKALEFKPDYAQAHFNLGNAFLQQGQTTEAIGQFQKLLALQPDLVVAQKSLATAYAEGGQFNQAVAAARRALQSAIQQNKTALAATIQTQLNSYEAKSAGRQ